MPCRPRAAGPLTSDGGTLVAEIDTVDVLQFLWDGFCAGALIGVFAVGFALIYHSTRVLHFAHGATYTAAAYACFWLLRTCGCAPLVAILGGLVGAVLSGVVFEWTVYAPLIRRDAPPGVVLISSIGLYVLVINAVAAVAGPESRVLSAGPDRLGVLGPVSIGRIQLLQLLSTFLAMAVFGLVLRRSAVGRLWTACADNPMLLSVLGGPESALRLAAFALGSLLAGIAALLSAYDVGFDVNVGMPAMLNAAVAALIAGRKQLLTPFAVGIALGVLQGALSYLTAAVWQSAATFALLMVVLILRPEGIFTPRHRVEEA